MNKISFFFLFSFFLQGIVELQQVEDSKPVVFMGMPAPAVLSDFRKTKMSKCRTEC